MKSIEERLKVYYNHEFFQQHPGLAEAIIDHENKTGVPLPDTFHIPPFVRYESEDNFVLLGKVHTFYLFGMKASTVTRYRLFSNKANMRLFFTQMAGKGIELKDLAFWLNQVEDVERNIQELLNQIQPKSSDEV